MESIQLHKIPTSFKGEVILPASKSISNRVLIIQALCSKDKKYPFYIHNLSEAEDTRLMAEALNSEGDEIYIRNAGTAMRFLTAYFAQSTKEVILRGSVQMNLRPIAPLVDGLNSLGADIAYLENTRFPPLHIKGKGLEGSQIRVKATISSQFISALMLIAPILQNGLVIEFEGEAVSQPYLEMTASIMEYFRVYVNADPQKISIPHQEYFPREYSVESDWSAASYFYALAALRPESNIHFPNLFKKGIQGDSIVADIMKLFGVETTFENDACSIMSHGITIENYAADLIHYPDLIPTIICLCAAAKIPFTINGTHTLKHKESNRAEALKTELAKLNIEISVTENSMECLAYREVIAGNNILLNTYNDHRLVMSFAILAVSYPGISIENPEEVQKSFPGYWEQLRKVGIPLLI